MPATLKFKSVLASLALAGVAACGAGTDAGDGDFEGRESRLQNTPGLAQLNNVLSDVRRVSYARSTGAQSEAPRLAFVSGNLGQALAPIAESFQVEASDLRLLKSTPDNFGGLVEHFEQTRNGLRVVGGDLRVTRNAAGTIIAASGSSWSDVAPNAEPSFDMAAAGALAMAETTGASASSGAELVYIAPSTGEAPRLAWAYFITGTHQQLPVLDEVFVDAHSGVIVDRHPHIHQARNRNTNNANGQENYGNLARSESGGATGDQDVDLAHDAAGITYDCFQGLFGRDSYDDRGATMSSVANFGQNFQNAYWDSENEVMVYGSGFAVKDVGTHEVGHAVTTNTANMVYQNEPGALNEAWSDIFSAVCDVYSKGSVSASTWSLGEEMQAGAFRFMATPTNDGYSADYYPERLMRANTEEEDFGGVHGNSGIANLAFYLASQGGTHPRGVTSGTVVGMGIDKAGQVFYRALTSYMNTNTDFAGARAATEAAATEIYGENSSESVSISEAWYAVGVGGPAPIRAEEPEPDPGDDGTGPGTGDGPGSEPFAGDLTGGCSTSGTQSPMGASLLFLLAAFALRRRRQGE
ncbi:MAG: M4 family metallopeptidase [Kofleriaceae bacterium]|nr:M4 family metallopeptidase [Kofleriaceae bacterium]